MQAMENITRKQPLPKIPTQMQLLKLAKQNILDLTYLSRKFQEYICLNNCQVKFLLSEEIT